jgi:hypothetical protein
MATVKHSKKVRDAADAFLALKAAQADLAAREVALKNTLLSAGVIVDEPLVIEGEIARVVISPVDGRETVDMGALRKLLSADALASVMRQGAPSLRFAAKARVADASIVTHRVVEAA